MDVAPPVRAVWPATRSRVGDNAALSSVLQKGRTGLRGCRLFLPRFFGLRAQLAAPAFPASGCPHRVPCVALHADHLVQPASLGLREAGHMEGEAGVV